MCSLKWFQYDDNGSHASASIPLDKGNKKWKGKVGVVTDIMKKFRPPKNSIAVLCGPPVMFRFVSDILNTNCLNVKIIVKQNLYYQLFVRIDL